MTRIKPLLTILIGLTLMGCGEKPGTDPTATRSVQTQESKPEISTTLPGELMNRQADADVVFVQAVHKRDNTWTFNVTVEHPDMGWDDYADGWDIITPDGTVLKLNPSDRFTRLLLHPHENEQPFTRSQSGIIIPEGATVLTVRAHDIIDGFGGKEIQVDLHHKNGPGFEIIQE